MRMIDVTEKPESSREATAQGRLSMRVETLERIKKAETPKGDPLQAAKIAGISAAKNTSQIIPLCHPIGVTHVDLWFSFSQEAILINSKVKTVAKTGVEMEALTSVCAAALTIYDMCKPMDETMRIEEVKLLEKRKAEL